jgi:hypothetical protein
MEQYQRMLSEAINEASGQLIIPEAVSQAPKQLTKN